MNRRLWSKLEITSQFSALVCFFAQPPILEDVRLNLAVLLLSSALTIAILHWFFDALYDKLNLVYARSEESRW